jgi:hypothetical protein
LERQATFNGCEYEQIPSNPFIESLTCYGFCLLEFVLRCRTTTAYSALRDPLPASTLKHAVRLQWLRRLVQANDSTNIATMSTNFRMNAPSRACRASFTTLHSSLSIHPSHPSSACTPSQTPHTTQVTSSGRLSNNGWIPFNTRTQRFHFRLFSCKKNQHVPLCHDTTFPVSL